MKKLSVLFIVVALCMLTSCSHVIDMVMAPFAPKTVPEFTVLTDGSVQFNVDYDTARQPGLTDGSWTQMYAKYVWRSAEGPYTGYELIYRVYNSGVPGYYTDVVVNENGRSEVTHDWRLPAVTGFEKNLMVQSNKTVKDTLPSGTKGRKYYYRVTDVELSRTYLKTDTSETITYTLVPKTSGWICNIASSEEASNE